jgi:hypothetical protein
VREKQPPGIDETVARVPEKKQPRVEETVMPVLGKIVTTLLDATPPVVEQMLAPATVGEMRTPEHDNTVTPSARKTAAPVLALASDETNTPIADRTRMPTVDPPATHVAAPVLATPMIEVTALEAQTPVAGDVDDRRAADESTAGDSDGSTSASDAIVAPVAGGAARPAVTQAAPTAAQPPDAPVASAQPVPDASALRSVTPTPREKPSSTEAPGDDDAATATHVTHSVVAPYLTGVDALMASSSELAVPTRSADARSRTREGTGPTPEQPGPPGGPTGFGVTALSVAGSSSNALELLLVAAIALAALSCRISLVDAATWKTVDVVSLLERPG